VTEILSPSSVIDFGSGTGAWLAAFRAAGVETILGLEGGTPDSTQLRIDQSAIRHANFEESIDVGRRFDLAMSVEVAEHLPDSAAARFVESMTSHADAVLFSAAIPGQGGAFHLNERWPTYWAELFDGHGFECFDPFRDRLWSDDRVEWWYRQNIVLYARGIAATRLRTRGYEAGKPRCLVQPALYERTLVDLNTAHGIRAQARGLTHGLVGRCGSTVRSRLAAFR